MCFNKIMRIQVTAWLVIFFSACRESGLRIIEMKTVNYPSGSAAEYYKNNIYIVGDDARSVLIMDRSLNIIDSIPIAEEGAYRISKNIKHDLEAITLMGSRSRSLLVLGSGSELPQRGFGLVLDPVSRDTQHLDLNPLYERIKKAGLKELNIEGVAYAQGNYILSNRGHMGARNNHLIFLPDGFWNNQDSVDFTISRIGYDSGKEFNGVSGLDYSFARDKLLITLSTEHTSGTSSDGAIGKSYLWLVDNIARSKGYEGINPFRMIDLNKEDKRFKGHKVESVTVLSEKRKEMELLLVSDNDDGKTTLFRVALKL